MAWYIPLLIFGARLCDVPIGTIRMILVVSGHRWLAAGLGFVEVLIWALAAGGLFAYLDQPIALVSYAGGFAAGTLVGMTIEDRIAMGFRIVRVINADPTIDVAAALRDEEQRVTRIEGHGGEGPVEIAFLVIRRRRLDAMLAKIRSVAPRAFVSVERADRASGPGFEGVSRVQGGSLGKAGGLRK